MTELWTKQEKLPTTKKAQRLFDNEVKKMTQKMIVDIETDNIRAEETRLANERREKEEKQLVAEKIRRENELHERWQRDRESRVENWRSFQTKTGIGKKRKEPEPDTNPSTTTPNPPPTITNPTPVSPNSTPTPVPPVPQVILPKSAPSPDVIIPPPAVIIPLPPPTKLEVPSKIPVLGQPQKKKVSTQTTQTPKN